MNPYKENFFHFEKKIAKRKINKDLLGRIFKESSLGDNYEELKTERR